MDAYDQWKLDDGITEDTRPVVGECFICGYELHESGDTYYEPDDYVQVGEELICIDCWMKFYRYIKKNGGVFI